MHSRSLVFRHSGDCHLARLPSSQGVPSSAPLVVAQPRGLEADTTAGVPAIPPSAVPQQTRRTRFVCISDTHNCTVKLPKGDVLIHCGDLTNQGSFSELSKQVRWLEKADFECKLVIAGNHDLTLDTAFYEQFGAYFHNNAPQNPINCQDLFTKSNSLTYLLHGSRTIKLASPSGPHTTFSVFGSPYTPEYGQWAFQYSRKGSAGDEIWKDIPLDTDILVTHGPAHTHTDEAKNRAAAGCESLRQAMWRVRPRLALCGHIHEARGVERVRWDLDSKSVKYKELSDVFEWLDPGEGNNKNSLADLTAKGGRPLENDGHRAPADTPQTSWTSHATGMECGGDKGVSPGIGTRGLSGSPESARSDQAALAGRLGRKETCIVNCAIQSTGYPHSGPRRLNKPIVVDLDLPVWEDDFPCPS
ncbi:Uu.00g094730.m01.CDS01 [Anthostomella pinea]|uniref:Uu.00g094730.m01.CDS01 n=1 Tax=Anthostomella pinea TaxID=933095 RepID=A0AAI8VPD3_9PEZI|nr:Uu.00g094730.m01.CDS01 [Anthostomella pinea]